MSDLSRSIAALRSLFNPHTGSLTSTMIWEPENTDPNFNVKRNIIAKAEQALAAGDTTIAGGLPKPLQFGDAKFIAIESMVSDAEQREYIELAHAIKAVATAINQAESKSKSYALRDRH